METYREILKEFDKDSKRAMPKALISTQSQSTETIENTHIIPGITINQNIAKAMTDVADTYMLRALSMQPTQLPLV